jgi:hypothetical protein
MASRCRTRLSMILAPLAPLRGEGMFRQHQCGKRYSCNRAGPGLQATAIEAASPVESNSTHPQIWFSIFTAHIIDGKRMYCPTTLLHHPLKPGSRGIESNIKGWINWVEQAGDFVRDQLKIGTAKFGFCGVCYWCAAVPWE